MKNRNRLYCVQQFSSTDIQDYALFNTFEEAESQRIAWIEDLQKRVDFGDSSIAESILESDLEGGCYNKLIITSHMLPGPIDEYGPSQTKKCSWLGAQGFDKIAWVA